MSLANKYRPQTFDQMIGQEHIIDILKAQMLARESVHHNYLLFGPRGTGKTTTARLIAKGLNCLDLQNGNPCNACDACQLINAGASLDYVEIDAASHTGVDNIREEIIDKALYPPTALRKKIYVIDEVHMLSKGAFNALLKTIEEPKSNVCFILATTELHKVPETIISRCQVFNYRKVAQHAMVEHLEKICIKEWLSASRAALEIIANISEGHVRDAVKYIDQVSILGAIDEENISKFLGVAGESTVKNFFECLKNAERDQFFSLLDQIDQKGIDLVQFAKQVIAYADQHLMEDIDFYLMISQKLGDLLGVIRWYPHPVMAYKIVFNTCFEQEETLQKRQLWTLISKKEEKSDQLTQSGSGLWDQASSSFGVAWGGETAQVSTPASVALTAAKAPESHPISAETSQEKPDLQSSDQPCDAQAVESKSADENLDFLALWQMAIAKLKPTAQANLKDGAIIEQITGTKVEIVVITSIAKMLITNEENKKLIISVLEEKLGMGIELDLKFESKDAYFARKMGI